MKFPEFVYGALVLIAVGIISLYLYRTSGVPHESNDTVSVAVPAVATKTNSVVPKSRIETTYEVVKTIDLNSLNHPNIESAYRNPVTGDVITYESSSEQSRNPVEFVLLNGKSIGDYTGYRHTDVESSPTRQYAGFKSSWVCGGGCDEYYVNLIDFKTGNFWSIAPPISRTGSNANLYIESFSWIAEADTMEIRAYMTDIVNASGTPSRMRVSHKQVWQYSLVTREFTFVRELQEE